MFKKIFPFAALVGILITILFAGGPTPPAGQVYEAQAGTTLFYLNQAFQGAATTQIFVRDGHYLVMWGMTEGQGWGFTLISAQAGKGGVTILRDWLLQTAGKGNIANVGDATNFVNMMVADGFKRIRFTDVPLSLRDGVATAWAMFRTGGRAAVARMILRNTPIISLLVLPVTPTGAVLCPADVFPEWALTDVSLCGITRYQ